MRKLRTLLALLLCASLLLGLLGCGAKEAAESIPTDPPVTEAPTEPPVSDQYTQAALSLRNAKNLALELTTKKTISAEAGEFELVSDQELIFTGIGTDAFAASLKEELEIGEYNDEFTEYYADGNLFVNIYDSGRFQGQMTEEDFLARFAPAVLLDETLYNEITEEKTDAGVTLTFADPVGPELWALPEGAEFVSGSGSAKISDNGTLTRTVYTLCYTQGTTTVSMEVAAKAEIYDEEPPAAPPEPSVYMQIEDITAPRIYDTALLFLYSTQTLSSNITQTILSQAAGFSLTEQTELHYSGIGQDHISDLTYTAVSVDGYYGTETYTQNEHYENGTYVLTAGEEDPESSTDISPADMVYYLQDHYSSNVPALSYISSMTAEEISGLTYLEMELNEKWSQAQADNISYLLFEDEEYLNSRASAYETTDSSYYIAVDPATGFPLSAGTSFSGFHTLDGADYILSLEIVQTCRLADPSTNEQITDKPLTEEAPEDPVTPLFYRVSGDQGQEMYLMGTIHVGDARTAFLPDAVYDALEKADALAVEADVLALEEQTETDPELATQIAMAYMNADGSSTKDLLDAELYDKAVKLLRISGNYNSAMDYMMPYFWSSSIDNFYITLSGLQTEKGMDMRLLKLAKEQSKEIREVESTLEQIEMFADFSPELQVLLLEETIAYTAAEYCAEVRSLYDQWCAGDEAALRELLAEDKSDLTEEDMTLYQEYLDAMIIRRNENMLDVATSYLESGDTVFYAVGLAHLLQENGLVDTLRDAGYTVEQVIYN